MSTFLKCLFCCILILKFSFSGGQDKGQSCVDASLGYRIYNIALSFKYDLNKVFSLDGDFIRAKYQPYGVGIGDVFYHPADIKFKPFVEAYFSRLFQGYNSFGESNDGVYTEIEIDPRTYLVPMIGVRYNKLEKGTNNVIGVFKIGYKINLPAPANVYYVSGPADQGSVDKINKYLENCIALNLGVVVNISKKINEVINTMHSRSSVIFPPSRCKLLLYMV
ncbi:hypothetical protein QEG73_01030 [Chitinophagaceae bacterium 26-R-25]|nr:hypothetical protein [Chitinophagaceae bacterium 26-R-25]